LVEPAEVGGLAAFLCRDEASAMSGSPVTVDLGWTAG
jgi:NAD(P)-dependent dehydrogenase (short-subunit alcohol dehydrogenase family)